MLLKIIILILLSIKIDIDNMMFWFFLGSVKSVVLSRIYINNVMKIFKSFLNVFMN